MKRVGSWLILSAIFLAQQPKRPITSNGVMLAAVSRDESMLVGGISSSKLTGKGNVIVEPLVFLSASGEWTNVPCVADTGKACGKFERDYLSKPHVYTVISADARGSGQVSACDAD